VLLVQPESCRCRKENRKGRNCILIEKENNFWL